MCMYPKNTSLILIICDFLYVFEVWWNQRFWSHGNWEPYFLIVIIALGLILVSGLYALDTYQLPTKQEGLRLFLLISGASMIFHILQPIVFRTLDLTFSLAGVVTSFLLSLIYFPGIRWMMYWARSSAMPPTNVLVLGEREELEWTQVLFEAHPDFDVKGYIPISHSTDSSILPFLGKHNDLPAIIKNHQINLVCLSYRQSLPASLETELLHMKLKGIKVMSFSDLCQQINGYVPLEYVDDRWFLFSEGFVFNTHPFLRQVKRLFDLTFSLVGLLILLGAIVFVWGMNKFFNQGPVFYSQMRVGLYGREFRIYKFRTMVPEAETGGQAQWASEDDRRAGKWGQIMRKTHIDELPQIWNVLKGDMSIVGPRPERREMIQEIEKKLPYYELRHFVKPGVTGWAQVNMPYADSIVSTKNKLQYDLFYLRHLSLFFDLNIIAKTIRHVLFQGGR